MVGILHVEGAADPDIYDGKIMPGGRLDNELDLSDCVAQIVRRGSDPGAIRCTPTFEHARRDGHRVVNGIPRRRDYRGPAVLSYGFRPFFLFGAIYAGIAVLAGLPIFNGELILRSAFSAVDSHVHEMLYGYLPAVVTGFLLTAIPNWTGRLPIQGMPLLVLLLVWLAGAPRQFFR